MDGSRFDQLTRALAHPQTRRTALKMLAGSALGGLLARRAAGAFAQSATPTTFDPRSVIFSDDFERGTLQQWSQVQSVVIEQTEVASGRFAARAISTGAAAYARTALSKSSSQLYARVRCKILRRDAGVYLLQVFTATDTSLVGIYLTDQGKLGFRNDVAGQDAHSTTTVGSGRWHELQVHLQTGEPHGEVAIWLDGAEVKALHQPSVLGTTPVGRIQIGESATGDTFDVAFDDVVVATQFIPPNFSPTAHPAAPTGTTPNAPQPTATSTTTTAPAGSCPAGQTACSGSCVNLATDSHNCGGCGTACTAGQSCVNAVCTAPPGCPAGQIACGADVAAKCVDLLTDPTNCGTCFTVCPQGQTCNTGACTGGPSGGCPGGCGAGQACCAGSCTDLGNEANCAACGNACSQHRVCCSSATGCVDPSSDPNNCGTCGVACAPGQTCTTGTCTGGSTTCPAGQADCGSGCISLGTEEHCSSCGDVCGQQQVCCSSATGCVATTSDPNNCGNCGTVCPPGQSCTNGACGGGTTCPAGQADCGNGCVDLGTEEHCAACGDVCGPGQVCLNGSCQTPPATCPAGQADCGNGCVNLGDEANCSQCGDACGQGQVCCNGACQTTC